MGKRKPPSRKAMQGKCDGLWSKIVRRRNRCALCGRTNRALYAHHLIPRHCHFYRHHIENGVCLCYRCHVVELTISAHAAVHAFEAWMQETRPTQYDWWQRHRHKVVMGQTIDYADVYEHLKAINENDKEYAYVCRKIGLNPQPNGDGA